MSRSSSMSTKQVQLASNQVFEAMGQALATSLGRPVSAGALRAALERALARQFGPVGGVLLVWYDEANGLRLNPASYEVSDGK